MAVVTWTGSTDTDYGTAGNWDTGSVPTSSDDVVIADVTNNCVLDGTRSVNSFTVLSGGDFNGNTEMLTVVGEADGSGATSNGFAVNIDGVIVGTNTNITVATPTATTVDFYAQGGGKVRHVTINHASCVATLGALLDISGNLTITAGELNTNSGSNYAVTVEGITTIGDGTGGTPDEATLTCNGSTCSFGSGVTADFGLKVRANGTFVGGSGTHTAGGFNMDQNASAKATMTSGVMTINSEKTSANKAWRVEFGGDTFDNNNGTVKFQLNGFDSRMSMRSEGHANNAFHNLIIDGDGDTRQISPDNGNKIKVDNDLTITRGKLVMGINHELEVGGDVVIDDASDTAELEMGSSSNISPKAATFGSLTIGNDGTYKATSGTTTITGIESGASRSVLNSGTLTHNSGTFLFNGAMDQKVSTNSTGRFNNITLNKSNNDFVFIDSSTTVEGNLDITMGDNTRQCRPSATSGAITVTGDVIVREGILLRAANDCTGAMSFGGLKLESGSIYAATSATTTITNRLTGESHLWKNDGGTFNHNNGTVKFNDNDHSAVKENTFYNVEVESNLGDYAVSFEAQGGGGNAFTILNNLTITRGDFELANADDTCDIHGQTIINGSSNSAARFNNDKNQTATITHHGLVTIIQGTYHVEDGATVNMAGIRNVGGLVD